jgi:hypothetical protein
MVLQIRCNTAGHESALRKGPTYESRGRPVAMIENPLDSQLAELRIYILQNRKLTIRVFPCGKKSLVLTATCTRVSKYCIGPSHA